MCGGLMICTSRPYALCHQLSSGADVNIAPQPQMQTHAPNGARNPQNPTLAARCSAVPAKVVRNATYPDVTPAIKPPAWINRCAGVQNVSRPMVICHEMSQYTPTITHAAANTTDRACHASATLAVESSLTAVASGKRSMAMVMS